MIDDEYKLLEPESDKQLLHSNSNDLERAAEAAIRPKSLADFVGQQTLRAQLSLVLSAAKNRDTAPDHVILAGPPGIGKTTLAMIIANEMHGALRITSGPAITHAGDLAAILSSLQAGDVLFIDEIHRLARPVQEMLYLAMEDFRVDVMVGKGPGATSIPITLPRFTVVGATTRAGLLPAPLRDRFGFTGHIEYYSSAELEQVILRSAKLLQLTIDPTAVNMLATRSRGTPRIANRLLRRVHDYALVYQAGIADLSAVSKAIDLFQVDSKGIDRLDRTILEVLCTRFNGGPVGLSTLAISAGEEPETVESVSEPYLVREGFIVRTTRGRMATDLAYSHLGYTRKTDALF